MAKISKRDSEFLELFHTDINPRAYQLLGAKKTVRKNGEAGFTFRVWAPNAEGVSVVGDFNGWDPKANRMKPLGDAGVWECFVPGLEEGAAYKYCFQAPGGNTLLKMDPYGVRTSAQPQNDSVTCSLDGYHWQDADWMQARRTAPKGRPINIYQLHLGSWRRGEGGRLYSYAELAGILPDYVQEMGYTHIELMPIMEYGFDGAWGYRTTSYFAPTFRYGDPAGLMQLIDRCHQLGIGVLMDWNIAHFPKDSHGLIDLDGGSCYEYDDPMKREHSQWDTRVFDYSRPEVRSFLLSNALFWLEVYHLDGLRLNNVSSMLYLDYGRESWEWSPNIQGGRENLEAIDFLRRLNETVLQEQPGVLMIAEEFGQFPDLTLPVMLGGLGFTHCWNVSWTRDMMSYFSLAPEYRAYSQDKLTFGTDSAFGEAYILPLSHEEFVYGKRSLMEKLPGLPEQKLAGVRSFFAFMMAYPGKKMSFMGSEFGQIDQWDYHTQLQWELLEDPGHLGTQRCIRELNMVYRKNCPLWEDEANRDSFYWIDSGNLRPDVVAFVRMDEEGDELIVVANFSDRPVDYRLGLPDERTYTVIFDSNLERFGGTQPEEHRTIEPIPREFGSFDQYAQLELAPYSVVYLRDDVQE
ncbi:MAG: 1,4-alpha-glucan branching protein GlgB [Clostridiales bacterium]|nr:1,4-alpha-glucan branching protein GlgB [Clostridiales bacterium]